MLFRSRPNPPLSSWPSETRVPTDESVTSALASRATRRSADPRDSACAAKPWAVSASATDATAALAERWPSDGSMRAAIDRPLSVLLDEVRDAERIGQIRIFSASVEEFLEPWFESEQLKVTLACRLSFLLKCMQHVNRLSEPSYVEHTICAGVIPHP